MKTTRLIPLFLIISFFSLEICEAQILNRIKQTAERAATRAVEKKVEREVEKAVERQIERSWASIFGEQTDAQGNPIDFSKIIKGMDMNVATEEVYEFDGMAVLEITGTDKNGKDIEPMQMHTFLSKEQPYVAMKMENQQSENMVMIFDSKNNASIILMDDNGEKTSIAYGIDWGAMAEQLPDTDESSDEDINIDQIKKTGKTKTILGHLCEEYEADNEEGTSNYWITKDNISGASNFWGNSSPFFAQKMKNQKGPKIGQAPSGNILEMNYASKTDKTTTSFLMTELDENKKNTFRMDDYPNMMKADQE